MPKNRYEAVVTSFGFFEFTVMTFGPGKSPIGYVAININHFFAALLASRLGPIKNYKRPVTAKDLRRFLGTLNYYHRFILRAPEQTPSNELLCQSKGKNIIRSTEADEASQ